MGMRKIYDNKNSKSQIETVRNAWIESMKRTPYGPPIVLDSCVNWIEWATGGLIWRYVGDDLTKLANDWLRGGAEGEHKQTKKNCLALEHMGFYTLFFLFTAQPRSTTFAIRTGTHTPTMHNRRICIQFFIGLFFMPLEQNAFFSNKNCFGFFFVWINVSIRRLQVMR